MRESIKTLQDYDQFCDCMILLFSVFGADEEFKKEYYRKSGEIKETMSREFGFFSPSEKIFFSEIRLAQSRGNLSLKPGATLLTEELRQWVIEKYKFPKK